MSSTDVERLATLEAEMRQVKTDVGEIKIGIATLNKIASSGGGAFNAILMLGGLIGWFVGVAAGVYSIGQH